MGLEHPSTSALSQKNKLRTTVCQTVRRRSISKSLQTEPSTVALAAEGGFLCRVTLTLDGYSPSLRVLAAPQRSLKLAAAYTFSRCKGKHGAGKSKAGNGCYHLAFHRKTAGPDKDYNSGVKVEEYQEGELDRRSYSIGGDSGSSSKSLANMTTPTPTTSVAIAATAATATPTPAASVVCP